ncbi:MAG: hypothetical protein CM15mP100_1870 [Alphaproteobacteria bacterium]|nr:MAG: hypothetical protein CM15mP100_1870 [Alphaproteobacteria bacterium]
MVRFAQVELRDIRDGTKLNERFRATESVERVILDEVSCTYLYAEDTNHIFMHGETFEQFFHFRRYDWGAGDLSAGWHERHSDEP